MPLKTVNLETLHQHVDALHILVNLILTEMSESNPKSLQNILGELRYAIDSTPQLHPELHRLLGSCNYRLYFLEDCYLSITRSESLDLSITLTSLSPLTPLVPSYTERDSMSER